MKYGKKIFFCSGSSFPAIPQANLDTGLTCETVDTLEFRGGNCTCPEGKTLDSKLLLKCNKVKTFLTQEFCFLNKQ